MAEATSSELAGRVALVTGAGRNIGRALAVLAGHRVTVSCVVPGLIETVRGAASGPRSAHVAQRSNALGRRGTPEDVARAVRFLAGPSARYITGQTLPVNGGAYLP